MLERIRFWIMKRLIPNMDGDAEDLEPRPVNGLIEQRKKPPKSWLVSVSAESREELLYRINALVEEGWRLIDLKLGPQTEFFQTFDAVMVWADLEEFSPKRIKLFQSFGMFKGESKNKSRGVSEQKKFQG